MSNLSNVDKALLNSIGVPPNILEKPVARSIVILVTLNFLSLLLRGLAIKAAASPVPISRTFFFSSNPTFSYAVLIARSPRDVIPLLISVESLIREAICRELSNNLFNILPDTLASVALVIDAFIS